MKKALCRTQVFFYCFTMITLCDYVQVPEEFAQCFYLQDYLSHLRIQWLTQDTINYYIQFIYRFIRKADFTTYKDFDNFLKVKFWYFNLADGKIWNNTLYKQYKCIKKYCDFLKDNELISSIHITKIPKVRTTTPLPKSLSEEDILKIREQVLKMNIHSWFLQMRNYMILETLLYTGMRRIELTQLKRSGIFDTHILIEQWKGQKDRIIYIPKSFSKQLKDWLEIQTKNMEYVFCDTSWNPISRNAVSCVFHRLEKAAWFKVHPHLLRHTYASMCVKKGINLYTLQQQMGHTSLKTTSIYLYLNSKENHEEMQKLRI